VADLYCHVCFIKKTTISVTNFSTFVVGGPKLEYLPARGGLYEKLQSTPYFLKFGCGQPQVRYQVCPWYLYKKAGTGDSVIINIILEYL